MVVQNNLVKARASLLGKDGSESGIPRKSAFIFTTQAP